MGSCGLRMCACAKLSVRKSEAELHCMGNMLYASLVYYIIKVQVLGCVSIHYTLIGESAGLAGALHA